MKNTKHILIAIMFLLGTANVFAQNQFEFSVSGGGGFAPLHYQPTTGKQKAGFGGHVGLGLHIPFSQKWSVETGAEVACYNSTFTMDNMYTRYSTFDINGTTFEFRNQLSGYEEKQHALLVQIPLMLQFKTGGTRQFYIAAGGKVGIPLTSKYTLSAATINNSGYYAEENSVYDTQTFAGFGPFANRTANGNLDFKVAFLASVEAGVKWRLGDKLSLYTGAYLDYGLNNIMKTKTASALPPIVEYNSDNPPAFAVNSIMRSQYMQDKVQTFTDKVKPIAAGIKLRLAFGVNCKKTQPPEPAIATETKTNDDGEARSKPAEEEAQKIAAELEAARKAAAEEMQKIAAELEAARKAAAEEMQRIAAEQDAARKAAEQEAARKAAEQKSARKAAELEEAKRQIQLSDLNGYILNQREPNNVQKQQLDKVVALLQQYPEIQIYIQSHTCDRGTVAANEKVGTERSQKVKDYLISKGIAGSRILELVSKRDTKPVVPNTNEVNRRKNRRVEFVVVN